MIDLCLTCGTSGFLPGSTLFCTEEGCPWAKKQEAKTFAWLTGQDLRGYNPERHDPDSVFFDDSYVGPSERELGGGCNRCGGPDDCYCDG